MRANKETHMKKLLLAEKRKGKRCLRYSRGHWVGHLTGNAWRRYVQAEESVDLESGFANDQLTWLNPNKHLPRPDEYVLIWVPGQPWGDSRDTEGRRFFKVARFVRGLSIAERKAMPACARKTEIHDCDEHGNNRRPYNWQGFGPDSYFGQEVKRWAKIPIPTLEVKQ